MEELNLAIKQAGRGISLDGLNQNISCLLPMTLRTSSMSYFTDVILKDGELPGSQARSKKGSYIS